MYSINLSIEAVDVVFLYIINIFIKVSYLPLSNEPGFTYVKAEIIYSCFAKKKILFVVSESVRVYTLVTLFMHGWRWKCIVCNYFHYVGCIWTHFFFLSYVSHLFLNICTELIAYISRTKMEIVSLYSFIYGTWVGVGGGGIAYNLRLRKREGLVRALHNCRGAKKRFVLNRTCLSFVLTIFST
jgi:hypothetical protein